MKSKKLWILVFVCVLLLSLDFLRVPSKETVFARCRAENIKLDVVAATGHEAFMAYCMAGYGYDALNKRSVCHEHVLDNIDCYRPRDILSKYWYNLTVWLEP